MTRLIGTKDCYGSEQMVITPLCGCFELIKGFKLKKFPFKMKSLFVTNTLLNTTSYSTDIHLPANMVYKLYIL